MEHAKKMMLIDSHDFRNAKRHHLAIDQDISDVLNRQGLDDAEKLRLYQQTLNKFLLSRQNIENELNKPIKVEQTTASVLDRKEVTDDGDNVNIAKDTEETSKKEEGSQKLLPKTKKAKKTPKKEAKSFFASLSDTLPRKRKRTQKTWEFY
jgi:hypothetical protein